MSQPPDDLSDFSMLELFRVEAENQVAVLTAGLLEVERDPAAAKVLEALMRAAHSLKGAARIVNLPAVAGVAHAMEDCFVAAQRGTLRLGQNEIDALLRGVDFFAQLARGSEKDIAGWETVRAEQVAEILEAVKEVGEVAAPTLTAETVPPVASVRGEQAVAVAGAAAEPAAGRVVRITAETVNRLLGLAGESLVESRRLQPFTVSMQRLKRLQAEVATTLDGLRQSLAEENVSVRSGAQLDSLVSRLAECREFLAGRLTELDAFDRTAVRVSSRLYQETLAVRMRPFGDGVRHFPRLVRDLAQSLGKRVRLEIAGANTQVDRDILERLDAPLTHLLRNAVDHGCETPEERRRDNKPEECVVRLAARHRAGKLVVSVADDGRGVDVERLRAAAARKQSLTPEVAEKLSAAELLDFLFLPGFTLRETVTEISGRGVGLDVVREMVAAVHGEIHVVAPPGRGAEFQLKLPVTLSVLRALLVEMAGEPYALPLAQIVSTQSVLRTQVQRVAGGRHFVRDGQAVQLVSLARVLERDEPLDFGTELSVVVLGVRGTRFGLAVDRFLGQREIMVQPLDSRLGKIRNVSAAALLEDGTPALILDVEDVVRSMARLAAGGFGAGEISGRSQRRVLVVDDSLTAREMLRKLLAGQGYAVAVAVDGVDAWNVLRAGQFDLVVTDVDMPRLDGLKLTGLIRSDARLRTLPVVMVSHKDRDEDRLRGLAAGADEYLTKSGFRDEALVEAVGRLTGAIKMRIV